jgi:Abnormal spindle-like microcephaly-assoc'd, ASPM-SPD-2-Hydin
MRLPQSILRHFSVHTVHFLTIGVAIALLGMLPASAGAATPQLTCTPSSLHFGDVLLGHNETLMVTLANNGQTSVTISGMAVGNADFTPSSLNLPLVLAAGQSVNLNITFTPAATGLTGPQPITFSSNASNPTLILEAAGLGVTREGLTGSPSIVSFGQVTTGTSSTVPVVVTSTRSVAETIIGLRATGSGFSLTGPTTPFSLAAGQSFTVNVTFAPQGSGTNGGSLFVLGPGLIVPLTGTGTVTPYSVNLFWNASSGVEGYNVYRSTAANGTYSKINPTLDSSTAFTDSTVVSGQTYYYAATAVNSSGQESARSTPPVQAAVP